MAVLFEQSSSSCCSFCCCSFVVGFVASVDVVVLAVVPFGRRRRSCVSDVGAFRLSSASPVSSSLLLLECAQICYAVASYRHTQVHVCETPVPMDFIVEAGGWSRPVELHLPTLSTVS